MLGWRTSTTLTSVLPTSLEQACPLGQSLKGIHLFARKTVFFCDEVFWKYLHPGNKQTNIKFMLSSWAIAPSPRSATDLTRALWFQKSLHTFVWHPSSCFSGSLWCFGFYAEKDYYYVLFPFAANSHCYFLLIFLVVLWWLMWLYRE